MKNHSHTVLGVFARRILRADLVGGEWNIRTGTRAAGASAVEAFQAAMDLTSGDGGKVWLISDEWFSQTLTLNPAQISGLNDEQLTRALCFEAEPFSGVPMISASLGHHKSGHDSFEVVVLPRDVRDRLIRLAGAGFAGIAHSDAPPAADGETEPWFRKIVRDLEDGNLARIGPPKPQPSPHRFRRVAVLLEIAALFLLGSAWWWIHAETRELKKIHDEYSAVARDLNSTRRQIQSRTAELASLQKDREVMDYANRRRLSLPLLLQALTVQKHDEIVVRRIQTNGPSTSEIHGVALTSDAVDELGIVLKESLRGAGWNVSPGHKKALKRLANGGPWEFSLSCIHEESAAEGVRFEPEEDIR